MNEINSPPVSVNLVALPESSAAVLYGIHEVLSEVGVVWPTVTGDGSPSRHFDVRIVSPDGQPFTSPSGLPIVPNAAMDEAPRCDIAIVTDLHLDASSELGAEWTEALDWLRHRFEDGALVCSVCTGSVFLAEAGLLDGLEATTHWAARDLFTARYRKVRLRAERVLCPAGPGHRIVTSGGAASWEELILYLIARFCGREEAVRIAKIYLFGDRSDGQLPFAAMTRHRQHGDAVIEACQQWIGERYAAPNPVSRMVEFTGLPARTFKRRFRAATGYAPIDYVQLLRVEEAKQMLEATLQPVDEIGLEVGYSDPASFRRVFKRLTGLTPARYRQRFRGLGSGVAALS